MDEEGWERDYTVFEELPLPKDPLPADGQQESSLFSRFFDLDALDSDVRPAMLRIMLDKLEVHVVEAAE